MKLAYNPSDKPALTGVSSDNKDIIFDLSGIAIYARGVKFDGKTPTVFKKHTSANTGGYDGLVPVPSYTDNATRFLREDGTWVIPDKTTSIHWNNIDGKPEVFNPSQHIHTTNDIQSLTKYTKATELKDLTALDTLNVALGKLEYKSDLGVTAYNWYRSVTNEDTDEHINKWNEIVSFLNGVTDTTLNGILNNFVNDLEVTGSGNAVTDVSKSNNKITVTKGDSFLPLSGGTISSSTYGALVVNRNTTSGHSGIKFSNNTEVLGILGVGGAGNSSYAYKPMFQDKDGKSSILIHSDNYTDYTYSKSQVDSALGGYLPLSGGTIRNSVAIPLVINNTDDGSSCINFRVANVDKAQIGYEDSVQGTILYNYNSGKYIGVKNDGTPVYSGSTLWHSGNFTPSDYLPLSGGTLDANAFVKIRIYSAVGGGGGWAQQGIAFVNRNDDVNYGGIYAFGNNNSLNYLYIGCNDYNGLNLRVGSSSIKWGDDTLIHSGNIGSQSVSYANNAGLADFSTYTRGFDYTAVNLDLNNLSKLMFWYYGQANSGLNNVPLGFEYGGGITFKQQSQTSLNGQFAWDIKHKTSTPTKNLWFRASNDLGWGNDWKTIAFTDSNVASATKLQTARTIWGQSFDGTGNVSGAAMGLGGSIDFQFSDEINRYGGNLYLQHRGDGSQSGTGGSATGNVVMCKNGGNVLIGTLTDSGYKLDVSGNAYFNSYVAIANNNGLYFKDNSGTIRSQLYIDQYNNTSIGYGAAQTGGNTSIYGTDIVFCSSAGRTERVRILSNGNVLIGTKTNSGYKLDVNGTVRASGFIKSGSSSAYVLTGDGGHKLISDFATATNATNARYARYVIADNNAKDPGHALLQSGNGRTDSSPSGDTWIYYDSLGGTSSPWGIKHEQASNLISFYGGGTRRAYIDLSNGNISCSTINGYTPITSGNIGSQSVNYASSAGNADKVDGYHIAVQSSAGTDASTIYFVI